jgi:hypothetical protein
VIFAPDGSRVATNDTPLLSDGSIVGTEQRFTPRVQGTYRVEHAEATGLVLAQLDAS